MEDLRNAAVAYYNRATPELQGRVHEFFRSMDMNGDGRINCSEFVAFFARWNYSIDPNLFRALDGNGDGLLEFEEFLTLYYILKTRYVRCNWCGVFQLGLYFTCLQCFDSYGPTYDLCTKCYRAGCNVLAQHPHPIFLDSYMLVHQRRCHPSAAHDVHLQELIPYVAQNGPDETRRYWWWDAFRALETVLSVGSVVVATAANCSIM